MTTSTSFSKEQRGLLNELLLERYHELNDVRENVKKKMDDILELQSLIGPSYDPEDVAFKSRCC